MLFDVIGRTTAVLVPGDREVSVNKLEKSVFPAIVRPLTDDDFVDRGLVKGYVGPQGLGDDVEIVADHTERGGRDWITGSNQRDRHVRGANHEVEVGRTGNEDACFHRCTHRELSAARRSLRPRRTRRCPLRPAD